MLILGEIARALGGEVAEHQVLCLGPGHSDKDRSVVVRPDPGSPGGLLVHTKGAGKLDTPIQRSMPNL